MGHAAIQLVVALPALAQTALKPKQVAVVRVKENRCHLLTGEKEQIYIYIYTIDGNFRIIKWRYSTMYDHILWGYPLT